MYIYMQTEVILTLTAPGGGGGGGSTNFATHAKPLHFQPGHFMTFYFEVLQIILHHFGNFVHSVTVNQKSEIFILCTKHMAK